MKNLLFSLLIVLSCSVSARNSLEFTDLYGDYLGQTPPGETPVVFARGIVSTVNQEHGATMFSPDGNEVFWWVNDQQGEGHLMTMRRINNRWIVPEVAPYPDLPVFSVNGTHIYIGGEDSGSPYFVEKKDTCWGEMQPLELIARFTEVQATWFLSVSGDNTLYIFGKITGYGLWNDYGIFRTEFIDGRYAKPEVLPPAINHRGCMNWTPYIAPDESYLIFSSGRNKPTDMKDIDLFICFKNTDGSWQDAINMGDEINTNRQERYPVLSPDGKYLFFTRDNPPNNEDVFWVSAKIIDKLREQSK